MSGMKSVSIFGATGSVGLSTIDLLRREPDAYRVVALTAHSDIDGLATQAKAIGAQIAVIAQDGLYGALKDALAGSGIEAAAGQAAWVPSPAWNTTITTIRVVARLAAKAVASA